VQRRDLETAGKEEDPVEGGAGPEVEEPDGAEFACEDVAPAVGDLGRLRPLDSEAQVEIGPAVSCSGDPRADRRTGDDPRVARSQLEHVLAHPIAELDTEHRPRVPNRQARR